MKLKFFCPRWGSEGLSWNDFFKKAKDADYDGVEIGFSYLLSTKEKLEITEGLISHELAVIGQHWQTIEHDFEEHQKTFASHMYSLAELKPLFINSQTGKDYFSMAENLALIEMANQISQKTGINILHETHRGKWSFAAHITNEYLKQSPNIRLTLDISHWCNVAESFLEDQQNAVQAAINHTDHLHARIGFQEGPQVIDPRAPENESILNIHLAWWDKLISVKRSGNASAFTITPEFGAPPYLHLLPYTKMPITNQWDVNVWMKDLLKERYTP